MLGAWRGRSVPTGSRPAMPAMPSMVHDPEGQSRLVLQMRGGGPNAFQLWVKNDPPACEGAVFSTRNSLSHSRKSLPMWARLCAQFQTFFAGSMCSNDASGVRSSQ